MVLSFKHDLHKMCATHHSCLQSLTKFSRVMHMRARWRRSEIKTLITWSGGPRFSGVGFFCFVSSREWKQDTNSTKPGSPTPCKQALNSILSLCILASHADFIRGSSRVPASWATSCGRIAWRAKRTSARDSTCVRNAPKKSIFRNFHFPYFLITSKKRDKSEQHPGIQTTNKQRIEQSCPCNTAWAFLLAKLLKK